ncbi:hypothetical protein B0H13DRAFT_1850280 [Mycena leptocephala]|nr:hypothetical protein B0H13DRAFT_1850280 [Mycena leptocephala]
MECHDNPDECDMTRNRDKWSYRPPHPYLGSRRAPRGSVLDGATAEGLPTVTPARSDLAGVTSRHRVGQESSVHKCIKITKFLFPNAAKPQESLLLSVPSLPQILDPLRSPPTTHTLSADHVCRFRGLPLDQEPHLLDHARHPARNFAVLAIDEEGVCSFSCEYVSFELKCYELLLSLYAHGTESYPALPSPPARATRSYQALAGSYHELGTGGLGYRDTTATESTKGYILKPFFPDVYPASIPAEQLGLSASRADPSRCDEPSLRRRTAAWFSVREYVLTTVVVDFTY